MEQDNQKLFSLYSAVNTLAYIAKMAQKGTATSGQLAGLNDRFQTGLAQVQQYLGTTGFNNFKLQTAKRRTRRPPPPASLLAASPIPPSNW